MTLKRNDIADGLVDKFDLSLKDSKAVVDFIFSSIIETLDEDKKVYISDFGTFSIRERKERKARNPKTGDALLVGPKRTIKFSLARSLKAKINHNLVD